MSNRPNVPQARVSAVDPTPLSMARSEGINVRPEGAVDVNEAIHRGARRVRGGMSRAARVGESLALGAVDRGIDLADSFLVNVAQPVREGLRESAAENRSRALSRRESMKRATQPHNPTRAKTTRRLNAMRVRRALGGARRRLGSLSSGVGQRINALGAGLREFAAESAAENSSRALSRRESMKRATQPHRPPTPVTPRQQTPPTPVTPKQKTPPTPISSPVPKPPTGVDVVDDVARSSKQAKGVRPYGKYGLGALVALGGGYGIHQGIKALRSKSNNRMKKVSSAAMNNGMPKNAVQHLLKTASAKLVEQERELAQLRQWYQEAQVLTKAASVADRLVATGQLDYSDRDDKAVELAANPDRLPIVEEAINMMHNPSAFSVASISDEYSDARTARTQLESYLLGH